MGDSVKVHQDGADLQITVEEISPEEVLVELSGKVNESSDLSILIAQTAKTLVIDLSDVEAFNSAGLRTWSAWAKTVPETQTVVLRNCTHFLTRQIGILPCFLPSTVRLHSFQIPYFCGDCDLELDYLAIAEKDFARNDAGQLTMTEIKAKISCPSCDNEAEIDVNPSQHFDFLLRF